MSQPVQIFSNGTGGVAETGTGLNYCVIDNGPMIPTAAPALSSGVSTGFAKGMDNIPIGAISQGSNAFKNGNIPDFVVGQTTYTTSIPGLSIGFKNPS